MALRALRLVFPLGTSVLRSGKVAQKASVHTTPARNLVYGWWAYMLGERTTPRFSQYSKIISVDGNLASGKGALAQNLAEQLGLLYMPEPDVFYLDTMTGQKEPLSIDFNGMCSLEKFYEDPKAADGNSYRLQLWMYNMRLLQYSNAVEHLLTTGQGVVLERSIFSDMVFLDAMFQQGYIRKECVKHYEEIKNISICEFLPPHLVIYVDVPAEEVHKKLQQSGKNVPLAYLKSIEDSYKKTFLPEISDKAELLVYDGTQAQDFEKVAEDVEILKFDKGPWLKQDDVSYHHMRILVQDKQSVSSLIQIPVFLPEITVTGHEFEEKYYAYRGLRGQKYNPGYNADVGDKYIWLK
nr:NADH dehydrogenase [ubiquinone] 1 alpha subcomplex subunit 10, mitochondrial-like [Nerophis lumbriciformis]